VYVWGERSGYPQSRNCPRVPFVCTNVNKVYNTERRCDTSFKALFLLRLRAHRACLAPLVTSLEELEASKSHLVDSNLHIIMLAGLSARFDA